MHNVNSCENNQETIKQISFVICLGSTKGNIPQFDGREVLFVTRHAWQWQIYNYCWTYQVKIVTQVFFSPKDIPNKYNLHYLNF